MVSSELKERIIYLLSTLDVYQPNASKTQHVVRCPYCGDSLNPSHGHFSIKIDPNDNDVMVYRCLKCNASGLFGTDILEDLGLSIDADIASSLNSFNRSSITKSKMYSNKVENWIIPVVQDSYTNRSKINYINTRLGTNLVYEDAWDHRIIFSIYEFLRANELQGLPGLNTHQLDVLERYYVGFMSKNNNTITFRNITSQGKRYLKYKIEPKCLNPDNFYNIRKGTDLLYTNDINVNIAEGVFDILSVRYNVREDYEGNEYYFAICGYGYPSIIRYLIYSGLNTGLNIHIYSDKDKHDGEYIKGIIHNPKVFPWIDSLTIHRNFFAGEKDFGVCKDHIDEKIRKIYTGTAF